MTDTLLEDRVPRLIEWPELRQLIPLSRSTIWRLVRDGDFPAPIQISRGRVAWLESEVLEWLAARKRPH
jgi:prophage regulatory protein